VSRPPSGGPAAGRLPVSRRRAVAYAAVAVVPVAVGTALAVWDVLRRTAAG